MDAIIQTLYENDFCSVHDFNCRCADCLLSPIEYQEYFSLCFVRTGAFQFKAFRNDLNSFHGHVLLNKPGFEYRVAHQSKQPDQCTIVRLKPHAFIQLSGMYSEALNAFIRNKDAASILVRTTPVIDRLYYYAHTLPRTAHPNTLQLDWVLNEIVTQLFEHSQTIPISQLPLNKTDKIKAIESAKDYIQLHHSENITLTQIANHTGISTFYFARIFKALTSYSPYDYLIRTRLAHAAYLLRTEYLPIQDVCYTTGFTDPFNFSTAFRKQYGIAPSVYRKEKPKSLHIPYHFD